MLCIENQEICKWLGINTCITERNRAVICIESEEETKCHLSGNNARITDIGELL